MTNIENATEIAETFNENYERFWNENKLDDLTNLYSEKSILVGYATVNGRDEIKQSLEGIINQGWTEIKINTVKVETLGENILVANEYEVFGSGSNEGKNMTAKSSQVLTNVDNQWLTAMHTAT